MLLRWAHFLKTCRGFAVFALLRMIIGERSRPVTNIFRSFEHLHPLRKSAPGGLSGWVQWRRRNPSWWCLVSCPELQGIVDWVPWLNYKSWLNPVCVGLFLTLFDSAGARMEIQNIYLLINSKWQWYGDRDDPDSDDEQQTDEHLHPRLEWVHDDKVSARGKQSKVYTLCLLVLPKRNSDIVGVTAMKTVLLKLLVSMDKEFFCWKVAVTDFFSDHRCIRSIRSIRSLWTQQNLSVDV